MKKRITKVILSIALLMASVTIGLLQSCTTDQPQKMINATVNITESKPPIDDFLYGMFMENLGNDVVANIVDDGLLAQVLDDRKFFYPVDNDTTLNPKNLRREMRQWRPVGPAGHVTMNKKNPYVGEQAPEIELSGERRGIQQEGFPIKPGWYDARIVMAGSPNTDVRARLVWGDGPDNFQEVQLPSPSEDYQTHTFNFEYPGNEGTGRLEITGTGSGHLLIGAVSLMHEDNVEGFRTDTIELLKDLNSGIYRWGGNFISGYNWRDGIGPKDQRPPKYDYAWEGLEQNDFGTFEFLALCRLVGVEPYMTVNSGFGDEHSAAEWVEYVNGSTDTSMGQLRAEHGHPQPFDVKYWNIGNEMYGWWQLGHMALSDYVIKHNIFAKKMLKVDPDMFIVATGAEPAEMAITGNAKRITGNVQVEPGSPADWTGGLLEHSSQYMDAIAEHYYTHVTQRFSLEEGEYVDVEEPLPVWALRPANRVRLKVEHYADYAERFPEYAERDIPIWLDEWSFADRWVHPKPELRITLAYAKAFHEMFRNTDLFKMAGFTFATTCLSFNGTDAIYNTNGLLFKMYRDHYGTIPVTISGNVPPPPPNQPVGGDQPEENASSDTWPLDVAAALNKAGTAITVSVVNPTENSHQLNLGFNQYVSRQSVDHHQIIGPEPTSRNLVGQEPEVSVNRQTLDSVPEQMEIEPLSINIYTFKFQ